MHHVNTPRSVSSLALPWSPVSPLPSVAQTQHCRRAQEAALVEKGDGRESRDGPGWDFPLYFFVQLIAGTQGLLHWGPMVRSMEVEELHARPLQPLQGCFQLRSHTFRLQRLPIPGISLGGNFHWQRERKNEQGHFHLQEGNGDKGHNASTAQGV